MQTILGQMLERYHTKSQSDEKTLWRKSYRKSHYVDFLAKL